MRKTPKEQLVQDPTLNNGSGWAYAPNPAKAILCDSPKPYKK